jgi:predicted nucleotidyltransferase
VDVLKAGSLEGKMGCAKAFSRSVAEVFKGRVYRVVLFGSLAKGLAEADSDIDVLVILDNVREVDSSRLAELALNTDLECGEPIEYVVMSVEEYRLKEADSPFISEVERWGVILYEDSGVERSRALKLVDLAMEYYDFSIRARDSLMYRAAIDLGHNAVELLVKALIMVRGEPLPRTHGGYIKRFSEIYLSSNLVNREVMVRLYRVLELWNKAGQEPDYNPTVDDVEYVLTTFNKLREVVRRILGK